MFEQLSQVVGVGSLLLVIIGTIGNFLTFLTCLRKRLRSVTTFVFFAFMALNDILSLYCWNLSHFVHSFFNYYHYNTSLEWCRISAFIQNVSLEWSAWLLVVVSVERYMSVRIRAWRKTIFNPKKAVIVASAIGLVLFLIHFHIFITNGIVKEANGTSSVVCYESVYKNVYPMWLKVHGYLYSITPFTLLFIANLLLVYEKLFRKSLASTKSLSNAAKVKQMTVTVMVMTFSFIIMTLPAALAGGYFYVELSSNPSTRIVINFCDLFSFSYHSLNFVVFLIFNKQFRSEWSTMMTRCKKSNQVSNITQLKTFYINTRFARAARPQNNVILELR